MTSDRTERRTEPFSQTEPAWWLRTLATARPGERCRVTSLVFSLVRDHCRELGFGENDVILCLGNGRDHVALRRPDGKKVLLEREYAWFVEVQPLEEAAADGSDRSPVLLRGGQRPSRFLSTMEDQR